MDDRFDMPAAGSTQAPFDPEALERILDLGDAPLRAELCTQLIADFQRLREAIAADDLPCVARAAHELKGLAATIGAFAVADQARTLDVTALSLPSAASQPMIAPLQGQVDRVIAALRAAEKGPPNA